MTTRLKDLQNKAAAATKIARDLAEAASNEDREMTADERSSFDAAMTDGRNLLEQIKAAKADADLINQARQLASDVGMPNEVQDDVTAQLSLPERIVMAKSLGQQFTEAQAYKELLAPFNGRPIPERTRINSDPVEFKALINAQNLLTGGSKTSGGAFVVTERSDIVEPLGRRLLTIRDLISVRRTASDNVEFVRQTSHTNNAAPVAEATSAAAPTAPAGTAGGALVNDPNGGYKPSTDWTFEVDSTSVKTIAEWTPVTKRALADVGQLEGLINDELVMDIEEAEENQIMNGNGQGQNLLGILQTSGIQTLAATTTNDSTKLASIRRALKMVRTIGRAAPTAIAMHPDQVEWVDTARDAQNRFYGNGPFGLAPRTLWNIPVVESEAVPSGTAVVKDWSKAVLWDREQATITATDSHADFFIRNLVAVLAEERVAFADVRPQSTVTVTGL